MSAAANIDIPQNMRSCSGELVQRDATKMEEVIGAKTNDLEWVQAGPTRSVKLDDPDAKIKFLTEHLLHGVGSLFDALGCFRRDRQTPQALHGTWSHEALRVWRGSCSGPFPAYPGTMLFLDTM